MIRSRPRTLLLRKSLSSSLGFRITPRLALVGTIALFSLLDPATAYGQSDSIVAADTFYTTELRDGSELHGYITESEVDQLTLTIMGGGNIEIERSLILEIYQATGRVVNGEYWHEDPNKTRLFFTPTANPLPQGEAYAGTFLIFMPFVGVGVTDHFMIAGGAPILVGELRPFWVAPKCTLIKEQKFNLAIGILAFETGGFFNDDDNEDVADVIGIAFSVGTI